MKALLRLSRFPLALLALLLLVPFAGAQTNQGQIAGNVVDSTGATIANAQITAKNEATGSNYTATSTSAGAYRFPSIELGRYTVTVNAPGFRPQVSTGVEVRVGTVSALDVTLSAGGGNETVTVAADAPSVETESSDVGGTVTTQQVVDLPLALGGVGAMRAVESFVFLIPGTAGPGTANNNNGIFINKIGGGQNFGTEILLDGASIIRSENGSSFDETAPSVEAIQEFKVTTSSPPAEFGRTTGGIENFALKSGTNSLHGTVFDIFRNEDLNANDWFRNGTKAFYQANPTRGRESDFNRVNDKQNDYGGSLGGPVSIPHVYNGRDKTFFFFAWEQYRHTLGGVTTSTVPTVAERTGNFQDQLTASGKLIDTGQVNPCDGTPIYAGEFFDPATTRSVNGVRCRSPFGTPPASVDSPIPADFNVIPASRINPVSAKLLSYYPQPNSVNIFGNYSLSSSSPITNTTYSVKIDQTITSNDKIFASYSTRENTRNNPTNITLPPPVDPDTQIQDFITHYSRAGWDHTFSPNILNHLNLGYNRTNSINRSFEAQSGTNYASQIGIPNIPTGFPRINVGGYVSLSRNQNGDNIDNGIRINDTLNLQRGRNSFKFGFDFRYQQYSTIAQDVENGYFNFDGNQTKATQFGPTAIGGLGQASFLLGYYDSAGVTIPFHQPRWISHYIGGFAQDDFKVSNNLVLNLGIRYDVDQPRKEATNSTSNFSETEIDPKSGLPGALVFGTTCSHCNPRWAETWFKDISPRIGFAFTPSNSNGKTVLRGGFATLYAPLQYSDFGGAEITGYTVPITQNTNGFDIDAGSGAPNSIDQGLAPYKVGTDLDAGFYDSGNSAAPTFFSNYIKSSYGRPGMVNQWNLQIQQELAKDLIMTIGYIGSAGAHLKSQEENINNSSPSTFPLGDMLSNSFSETAPVTGAKLPYPSFNTTASYVQALRPFPQYDFIATDCCLQNVGHSSYEALIASVERRFSQGLNLQASYTWAKSITNADSIINVTNGVQQEQNPNDSKLQKSLSNQDIPNTFVASFLYELPFGKNKAFLNFNNSFLRSFISGFELGGVLRYQSGQPTSFGGATGIPGFQNHIDFVRIPGSSYASNVRRHGHIDPFRQLRANYAVGGPDPNVDSEFNGLTTPVSARTGNSINPGYAALQTAPAFYDQNQSDNRRTRAVRASSLAPDAPACPDCDNGGFLFGDVPRVTGEIRNYHYNNEDFSLLKKTPIGEGKVFTFKVELLNAFNRHVFATPDVNPGDAGFGVPGSTIDTPRNMQLTARIQF